MVYWLFLCGGVLHTPVVVILIFYFNNFAIPSTSEESSTSDIGTKKVTKRFVSP